MITTNGQLANTIRQSRNARKIIHPATTNLIKNQIKSGKYFHAKYINATNPINSNMISP